MITIQPPKLLSIDKTAVQIFNRLWQEYIRDIKVAKSILVIERTEISTKQNLRVTDLKNVVDLKVLDYLVDIGDLNVEKIEDITTEILQNWINKVLEAKAIDVITNYKVNGSILSLKEALKKQLYMNSQLLDAESRVNEYFFLFSKIAIDAGFPRYLKTHPEDATELLLDHLSPPKLKRKIEEDLLNMPKSERKKVKVSPKALRALLVPAVEAVIDFHLDTGYTNIQEKKKWTTSSCLRPTAPTFNPFFNM